MLNFSYVYKWNKKLTFHIYMLVSQAGQSAGHECRLSVSRVGKAIRQ